MSRNLSSKAPLRRLIALIPVVLVIGSAQAELQDTLKCYQTGKEIFIGGPSTSSPIDFNCPSCISQTYCDPASNYCFSLSTNKVFVFEGSELIQTLDINAQCIPLGVAKRYDLEYAIRCASTAPSFKPRYQVLYNDPDNGQPEFEIDPIENELNRFAFAQFVDNFRIVISELGNHLISILGTGNSLSFHFDINGESEYEKIIPPCATITEIIEGDTIDNDIQLVVKCVSNEGQAVTRLKVSQRLEFTADPVIEELPRSLEPGNDKVKWSPQSRYILYIGSSTVLIVNSSQTSHPPGILRFEPEGITEVNFINDDELIITVIGRSWIHVKLSEYFDSSFESGVYEVPQTEANCVGGICNPTVFQNNVLYGFVTDPDSVDYSILISSDLQSAPYRIARVQNTEIYDLCFPTRADITVLPQVTTPQMNTSTNSTEAPPATSTETPPAIHTEAPPATSTETPTYVDIVLKVAIIVSVVLVAVVILAIILLVLSCIYKYCKKKRLSTPTPETGSRNSLSIAYNTSRYSSQESSLADLKTGTPVPQYIALFHPRSESEDARSIGRAASAVDLSSSQILPSEQATHTGRFIDVPQPSRSTTQIVVNGTTQKPY